MIFTGSTARRAHQADSPSSGFIGGKRGCMRSIVKAAALALLVCGTSLAAASAADKPPPASDPGEEIKDGAVQFGHGIRDGAIRAWGAVKSVFSGGDTADKPKAPPPPKATATGSK